MVFVDELTLKQSLKALYGTADHMLKIWFTLKQMGMTVDGVPAIVDTQSPTPSLKRLFSFGSPEGKFYVPFAHTTRFLDMKGDAARSIIQTNIQRWYASDSVVTVNPTNYLSISQNTDNKLEVRPGRTYPAGLGNGDNGFALSENQRVSIPALAFAVWYGRQTPIPSAQDPAAFLLQDLKTSLNLSDAEFQCIFIEAPFSVSTASEKLSDSQIFAICNDFIAAPGSPISAVLNESFTQHTQRLKSMLTLDERPQWLRKTPSTVLKDTITAGAKAILLYGPPRTGKTRAIDLIQSRNSAERTTIQIHDGWTYDHLIQGLQPNTSGQFEWQSGALKRALEEGKKYIVLEEINRTASTQALGEVFSLMEEAYRGPEHKIKLRNGEDFFIPADVTFFLTMNTIDQSTEEVDDALLGRFYSIEFPPRPEDLHSMLEAAGVPAAMAANLKQLFATIQDLYPLGHGYFAQVGPHTDFIQYYVTRIRPVLANHLQTLRPADLTTIDNQVDVLFATANS